MGKVSNDNLIDVDSLIAEDRATGNVVDVNSLIANGTINPQKKSLGGVESKTSSQSASPLQSVKAPIIPDAQGFTQKALADNIETTQQSPAKEGAPQKSVFDYFGTGLRKIFGMNVAAPINALLQSAGSKVKEEILKDPNTVSAFKKDVQKNFNDKIAAETSYGFTDPLSHTASVPVISKKGQQLKKERDDYLKQLDDSAAESIGGQIPIEQPYLDKDGKTRYKTFNIPTEQFLEDKDGLGNLVPDMAISKMEAIGKALMKVTNPQAAEQLDANTTPYLSQQAQFMGIYARGKYLNAELSRRVDEIKKNPIAAKAFSDYTDGKATPEQINLLDRIGVKKLYDEFNGLNDLQNEVTHADPSIRENFLKKALFNELTNRFGANQGFLGMEGWTNDQLKSVVNDYRKRLTDPRDIRLLDDIQEDKELGILGGDNQSWASKMAGQFVGTFYNTAKYLTDDLLSVDVPNIFDREGATNRNKEQQLKMLKQADADRSNVTIDFKPDKKQFFLKQYVDTDPESETFLQTLNNYGQMDGSFFDKVLYNSASQFGQLGAQMVMGAALPTFGKAGFYLSKVKAPLEFIESKNVNFLTKVALPAFAMTYDNNYKASFDVVGTKDAWKNNLYATLTSSYEGLTERLGNPLEQTKFLTSAFKKDVGSFIKNLSVNELQKMGKEEFLTRLKNISKEAIKGAGRGAAQSVGESNEEVLNEGLTGVTQLVFNKDYTTPANIVQQAGQTWLETFAGMGFMPATGVVSSAKSGWGSKFSQDATVFLGKHPMAAIDNIDQAEYEKKLTEQEALEKKRLVLTSAKAYEQSKKAAQVQQISTGKQMSKSNLAALTMARANEIELDNQIEKAKKTNDAALGAALEDKKNHYTDLRKAIINDEMWVDPITGMPEVPTMANTKQTKLSEEEQKEGTYFNKGLEITKEEANSLIQNGDVKALEVYNDYETAKSLVRVGGEFGEKDKERAVQKVTKIENQPKEQVKIFNVHKKEADAWLDTENTRLRRLFGIVPFNEFKKEYDNVKDEYTKKIGEAAEEAKKPSKIEAAIIEVNGKTYEGKNHAEAILKAKEAGEDISKVDRKAQGQFRLANGAIVNREEAKDLYGADRSEKLIEQDEASKQANKDYEKEVKKAEVIPPKTNAGVTTDTGIVGKEGEGDKGEITGVQQTLDDAEYKPRSDRNVIVRLPIDDVLKIQEKGENVERGQKGVNVRVDKIKEFLKGKPKNLEATLLGINKDNSLGIDGRHRLVAAKEMGATHAMFEIKKTDEQKLNELLKTDTGIKSGTVESSEGEIKPVTTEEKGIAKKDIIENVFGKNENTKLFNYENTIAEKDINGVKYRITEGDVKDGGKTYFLYKDKDNIGEFNSVNEAKNAVKDESTKPIETVQKGEDVTDKKFIEDYFAKKYKDLFPQGINEYAIVDIKNAFSKDLTKYENDLIDNYLYPQKQKSQPTKPIETIQEQKQTINDFTDRIAKGEKMTSPEDLQFYENNKKEIEQILKQKQEQPTEQKPSTISSSEVESVINEDELSIYELNKIPKGELHKGISGLKESISKEGFREPLILMYYPKDNALRLLEGHHRLAAANELGIKHIPTKIQVVWGEGIKEGNKDIADKEIYHPPKPLDIEKYKKRNYYPTNIQLEELGYIEKPSKEISSSEQPNVSETHPEVQKMEDEKSAKIKDSIKDQLQINKIPAKELSKALENAPQGSDIEALNDRHKDIIEREKTLKKLLDCL